MSTGWWVTLAAVMIFGPLITSAFVCVPKWWRARVAPTAFGRRATRAVGWLNKDPDPSGIISDRVKMVLVTPFIIIAAILIAWFDAWRILIRRACPYSDPADDGFLIELWQEIRAHREEKKASGG